MKDDQARAAVIWLMQRGLCTEREARTLAAVSKQLNAYWIKRSQVDHKRLRNAVLAKLWTKALRNVSKLRESSKPRPGRKGGR
jgi:hypothetical protein